jgi:hypothetical protein
MMIWLLVAAAVWGACGVYAYGLTFAYSQREFARIADEDRSSDRCFAIVVGACGPLGLLAALINSERCKHGLKWT